MIDLLIITESFFTKSDFERFGIRFFINKGLKVEIWNLAKLLRPTYYESFVNSSKVNYDTFRINYFDKMDNLLFSIDQLNNKTIVISNIGYSGKETIFNRLYKNKIKFGSFLLDTTPTLIHDIHFYIKKSKNFFNSIKKGYIFKKSLIKKQVKEIRYPLNFLLIGAKMTRLDNRYPTNKNTKIIQAHSLSYDYYILNNKNKINVNDNYLVFLDSYLPFHPDYIAHNMEPNCSSEKYYPELNNYFTKVEKILNKQVVILAHPKSQYSRKDNYFNDRKIIYNSTCQYVKNCDLVLAHSSIALNYAVLFNKPITLIDSNNYLSKFRNEIYTFKKSLGCHVINISKLKSEEIRINNISNEHYANYKNDFILEGLNNSQNKKLSYEIFFDEYYSKL